MNDEELKECLKRIPKKIETEASGNISIERCRALSDFGLDFVSVGALTHSAPCADFSLILDWATTGKAGGL